MAVSVSNEREFLQASGIFYATSPEGDLAFTVSGLPCAGRWISCRNVGLLFDGKAGSSTVSPC
jgi:hypothetical protein